MFWVRSPVSETQGWAAFLPSLAVACVLIAVGFGIEATWPEACQDDLLRVNEWGGEPTASRDFGWPVLPGLAAGAAVVGLAAVGTVGRRPRLAHVGRAATAVTLVLAVALVLVDGVVRRAWQRYDAALAQPLSEQTRALVDPNAFGLLDALRAWEP
jgi:hypothetical protein